MLSTSTTTSTPSPTPDDSSSQENNNDAKKVKLNGDATTTTVENGGGGGGGLNGPSRVVHIRNIPSDVSETEIVHLGIPFGRVSNVLVLKVRIV